MRAHFSSGIVAIALISAAPCAHAAEADPSLKAFIKTFAQAAGHGDVSAVAKLTVFPLKNAVYREPDSVSAAGFKKHFQNNVYKEMASCLKTTPPESEAGQKGRLGDWDVNCNGFVFHFAKRNGKWRHSAFENINE